ncbi:MAG TPA: YihY/virulence factor BrkB family protein [Flavipsychrobacter sp.]
MSFVKSYFKLLKEAFSEFSADNVVKLSASLAYYTVFAIGPLLLVIISLTGLFFEKEAVTGELYNQISNLVGKDGAEQVFTIIRNMQEQQTAARYSIIGSVILIFGATGVFADIQDSINYIWSIRAKPKKGWLKFITNRLLSFSLIIGIGFLMIVTLFVNTLTDLFTDRLQRLFNSELVILFQIINLGILFLVVSFLFAVIYKVLPDARIRWRDAFVGARFTGLLFLIGKFLIGYYLGSSSIGSTYGAAASIIIVLSWVYYTAIILYFGAEFTKVYALNKGGGIEPYSNAVFIIKREAKELDIHNTIDASNQPKAH